MSPITPVIPFRRVFPISQLRKEVFTKSIAIPLKNEIRIVHLNTILYLKADGNYTEIYLENGSKIVTSTTLKKYEGQLDPSHFMRVHNSYIIQHARIEHFFLQDNRIVLNNAQEIPVSRSRKKRLLNYLKTMML